MEFQVIRHYLDLVKGEATENVWGTCSAADVEKVSEAVVQHEIDSLRGRRTTSRYGVLVGVSVKLVSHPAMTNLMQRGLREAAEEWAQGNPQDRKGRW